MSSGNNTKFGILVHYQVICHDEHNVWSMMLVRGPETTALLPTLDYE
jgi:hypothetical protein